MGSTDNDMHMTDGTEEVQPEADAPAEQEPVATSAEAEEAK